MTDQFSWRGKPYRVGWHRTRDAVKDSTVKSPDMRSVLHRDHQ